jgi:putative hydrolase of the HAD superfamily
LNAPRCQRVWLFDLDNTLHNASHASMAGINAGMTQYMMRELQLDEPQAAALRRDYWQRYGATLLGLIRHHAIDAAHFLHETHRLPGFEARVHGHAHDLAALKTLRGRKIVLTNAPRAYALRVLAALGIARWFDMLIAIEDMRMFGHWRPKPDARMLRRLAHRLRVPPCRCVLVEDTLEHQKAARRVGMQTVWMQRFDRSPEDRLAHAWRDSTQRHAGTGKRLALRPPYVDLKTHTLRALHRRWP